MILSQPGRLTIRSHCTYLWTICGFENLSSQGASIGGTEESTLEANGNVVPKL